MKILRTPDDRFADLLGFPYPPRYCQVGTGYPDNELRIHYILEGPPDAPVVLLLHGEPVWSYLWRNLIPSLTGAGHQVLALDLPGFGRSDKPAEREKSAFQDMVHWVRMALFLKIGIEEMTIIGQGLGGLVGLAIATAHWRNIPGVLAIGLPTDPETADAEGARFSVGDYRQSLLSRSPGEFVQSHTVRELPPEVIAAYEAPFASSEVHGMLGAAMERATTSGQGIHESVAEIWSEIRKREIETLLVAGEHDRFGATRSASSDSDRRRVVIPSAGHFVAEDNPDELARTCLEFLELGR